MNRVIKFRAWDNKKKLWLYDNESTELMIDLCGSLSRVKCDSCETPFRYLEDYTLSQFTGLTDKNGKEIYEGDIYKTWYSRDMGGKDVVEVIEKVEIEDNTAGKIGYEILFYHNAEVIGNIFESPELLNQ